MGDVKIRYYTAKHGRGYWQATRTMQEAGFPASVTCGKDGPDAWRIADQWNEKWDRWRFGIDSEPVEVLPPGSLGDAFNRYRLLDAWKGKAKKTRMEWERAWLDIKSIFADVDPSTVALEDIDAWYSHLLKTTSVDRAWRAMKIWRALWKVAASMKYCERTTDPSLGVRRQSQPKRSLRWSEGEVVRLIKCAIRTKNYGLACIMAVAWDSQLSPIDVRTLTPSQRQYLAFTTARAKTGKAAVGTISRRTERLITEYLESLGVQTLPDSPLFRSQTGAPFTDQTLSKSFSRVRERVFKGDRRTLMDMRRSGAIEALAGGVDPSALAAKMANSIDTATDIQATYLPVDPAVVRLADEARRKGRAAMRKTLKNQG